MKKIILEQITSFNADLRNLMKRGSSPRASLLIPLLVVCLGLVPGAQAVVPPPDGGYPGSNTAEGENALFSLSTGVANVANGWFSLKSNTDGSFNTAVGAGTLLLNIGDQTTQEGTGNTAVGAAALLFNTTGFFNVAVGALALRGNSTGGSGFFNNAVGAAALDDNVVGSFNNAHGRGALQASDGDENNAFGDAALFNNVSGSANTAIGDDALFNCTGDSNVAVGDEAGTSITTGSNIIAIGAGVSGISSVFGEVDDSCYIGNISGAEVDPVTAVLVAVDADVNWASRASPMGKAFHYKISSKTIAKCRNWKAPSHSWQPSSKSRPANPESECKA